MSIVLGLVLVAAIGGFIAFVPGLLGIPFDPVAWVRGRVESTSLPDLPAVPTMPDIADPTVAPIVPSRRSEGPTGAATHPTPNTPSAPPNDDVAPAPSPFGDRDPWLAPMSRELARFRSRVDHGETIGDGARASLRLIMRDSPGDPRPLLLMAHSNFAAGARTDAIGRYERAMDVSPSAQYDPLMLHNLVVMSAHRTVGDAAADMVREVYGPRALPELRAVRTTLEDTDEIERLDAFEVELLAMPPRP